MSFLFLILVGPVLFLLLLWGGATVYRIYNPERPLPFNEDPVVQRERATAEGTAVPVGVREIRADQRRTYRQADTGTYHYAWGGSEGIPEDWRDQLWKRRN
jgi:hypothetical protein